jgi:hypothetical protein
MFDRSENDDPGPQPGPESDTVPCNCSRICRAMPDFACMPADVETRVAAMGEAFGLPLRALRRNPAEWFALLAACSSCADREACDHCQDSASLRSFAAAGLCPNAAAFATLARLRRD